MTASEPSHAKRRLTRATTQMALIRTIDLVAGLFGGLFLLPFIVVAAIAVRLDSPGPGIFAQTRVGREGQMFTCYKLRTMAADTRTAASHEQQSSSVTRLGHILRRTKLDELPQLLNVLIGDMSLVGPRPSLPGQTELIAARRERGIYAVRPGITGPAQVVGLDMSKPLQLAEEDARWATRPTVAAYVKFILLTLAGKGQGDAIQG